MHRLLVLLPLLLLLPPTADAQYLLSAELRYAFTGLDAAAGTAPTLLAQGAPLRGVTAFRVRVQPDTPSTTFAGAGRLSAYYWQVSKLTGCTAGCYWRAKQLDCSLSAVDTGQLRVVCGDFEVKDAPSRSVAAIAYVPEGVTLSAPGTVSVEVEVVQR
jgi:hypothetical protein